MREERGLSVTDAVRRIVASVQPLAAERVPLLDAAGRVLATDAVASVTLPPWDNSAMDGYAARRADLVTIPVTLPVVETVAAGQFPSRAIGAGEVTRIMTGAPVPEGADTVIRVEDTDGGTTTVTITNGRDIGKHVRPRGEDIHAGAVAIPAGTPLGAAQLGVLASLGFATVEVIRRPRVAILTSGDELVEVEEFDAVRAGRKIVSSNTVTLQALVREAGGIPTYLGIAQDTPESLRARLERARGFDLVITSAGISVGEFDHVRDVLVALGARMDFWRVRMRPGAPIGFGSFDGSPWIGLPGNPVSTMVTFELFVRPALARMSGHELPCRTLVPVTLEEPVTITPGLTHFLRAVVRVDGVRRTARLTGPQGSGILTSMSLANALLVVPADCDGLAAGATVQALLLRDDAASAREFTL